MPTLSIERLGHVNSIVGDIATLRGACVEVFGAHVFSDWADGRAGSANSLLLVSDACMEIFGVENPASTLGQYLQRYGPGWHSLEWTVPSQAEAEEVARSRGIEITDRVDDSYAWLHPKQCHGLLIELSSHHFPGDPRDDPDWRPAYWSDEHPMGIVGLGCVRVSAADPYGAAAWLADLTGGDIAYDRARPGVRGRAVAVALPGHAIEFIGPEGAGAMQDFLARKGERIHSVAFEVADLDAAVGYLADRRIGTGPGTAEGRVFVDETLTGGALLELALRG